MRTQVRLKFLEKKITTILIATFAPHLFLNLQRILKLKASFVIHLAKGKACSTGYHGDMLFNSKL